MLSFTYRRQLWSSLLLFGGFLGALAAVIFQVVLPFTSESATLVIAFASLSYLVFEIPIGMSGGLIAAGLTSLVLLLVPASSRQSWRVVAVAAGGFVGGGIGMLWIRGFFGWEESPVLAFAGAGIVMSVLFVTCSLSYWRQSESESVRARMSDSDSSVGPVG